MVSKLIKNLQLKENTRRTVPPYTEGFCAVYDFKEKADLSKRFWNPKRKLLF